MELNKKILKQIRKAINIVLLIMILGMVFVLKNYASNDNNSYTVNHRNSNIPLCFDYPCNLNNISSLYLLEVKNN